MVGIGKANFLKDLTESLNKHAFSRSFQAFRREKTFRIGVLTSLAGRWKKGGYNTKRGYDIWAERVNESGGIEISGRHYKVQLIYYDIQSDPGVAKQAARELITGEGVDFIFGPYSSELTLAVAPIIEELHIPHITGSAESHEILKKGFKWTFGVLLGNPAGMKAPLRILKEHINSHLETTAIVCANDVFSQSTAEAFLVTSEELGFKLTHYQTFPSDQGNLIPVVSEVDKKSPDVLIVCGHVDDLINSVKAAKAIGFDPGAFVMHYGVDSQDFVDALGGDAARVLGVSQWSPKSNFCGPVFGSSKHFHDLFVSRYGREPDHIEAGSAATGAIFQQVVQLSEINPPLNKREKRKLRNILAQSEFKTFFGVVNFSSFDRNFYNL
jgi:branched-chain amino acid transport system substrate-binding protein